MVKPSRPVTLFALTAAVCLVSAFAAPLSTSSAASTLISSEVLTSLGGSVGGRRPFRQRGGQSYAEAVLEQGPEPNRAVGAALHFCAEKVTAGVAEFVAERAALFRAVEVYPNACAGATFAEVPLVTKSAFGETETATAESTTPFVAAAQLIFLDIRRSVFSQTDATAFGSADDVEEALAAQNIHRWTQVPNYQPEFLATTRFCRAFRQTAHCDPDGPREPGRDTGCDAAIEEGRSGYCECVDGSAVEGVAVGAANRRVVLLPCGHEEWTCARFCDPQTVREWPSPERRQKLR